MNLCSLGARPLHVEGGSGKLVYINSLWDVASLQASYAIIEGVDWVQICMCSISNCRLSLPVKILVTKRPFDSTLESATASFDRQFKHPIAGNQRTVVLANEICVTCVGCSHEINSHKINSHEINSHEINSHEINFSRDQFPYDQLNFFLSDNSN